MIQARFRLRTSGYTRLVIAGACLAAITATIIQPLSAGTIAALLAIAALGAWVRGVYRAGQAVHVFDIAAGQLGLIRCDAESAAVREAPHSSEVPTHVKGQSVPPESGVPSVGPELRTQQQLPSPGVNGQHAPSENGAQLPGGNGVVPPAKSFEPSSEASS